MCGEKCEKKNLDCKFAEFKSSTSINLDFLGNSKPNYCCSPTSISLLWCQMFVPHIMSMVFSYLVSQMAIWQVQITTLEGQVFTFPQKMLAYFQTHRMSKITQNTNSKLDLHRLGCTHLVLFRRVLCWNGVRENNNNNNNNNNTIVVYEICNS
jgi:hypothetical protein